MFKRFSESDEEPVTWTPKSNIFTLELWKKQGNNQRCEECPRISSDKFQLSSTYLPFYMFTVDTKDQNISSNPVKQFQGHTDTTVIY